MFAHPLACAFLLLAGVNAQTTAPVSSEEGFLTIQTIVPSNVASSVASSVATDGESTSACLEVCVVEPCTQCPLTNPLRTTESIPQLTFCDGVYTNTPCSASATGQMSIPQGETPEPTSASASSTGASASEGSSSTSQATGRSSTGSATRITPTSSASGSVPSTSTTSTPGAAVSTFKRDGSLVWVAALTGLSATLGFAWTLL